MPLTNIVEFVPIAPDYVKGLESKIVELQVAMACMLKSLLLPQDKVGL